jgi:hypothetical protein
MASDSRQELITKGPGLTRHPGLSASFVRIWLESTYLGVPYHNRGTLSSELAFPVLCKASLLGGAAAPLIAQVAPKWRPHPGIRA